MKIKHILLSVAATLASSQAFALTPVQIEAARAAGTLQQTWISGASAPTSLIYDGFALGCTAGTIAIHTTTNPSANPKPGSIGNFFAYSCTRAGVASVMYHTIDGGSLNAYRPHTVNAQLGRVSYVGTAANTGGPAQACTTTTTNYVEGPVSIPVYRSCTLASGANAANATYDFGPKKPAGGYSDVEAAAFPSAIGGGDVSSLGTESEAFVDQTFGVVVSTNLYRALQTAQGINTATDPDFDPLNAPNITSAQYTSIASQGGAYQIDWSPILGAPGNGKRIVLARRVDTSGSQAASNIHFLRNPCAGGFFNANLNPATVADSTSTFVVTEGSGTGNVKVALTTANNAGDFAIGVVSAENDWRIETSAGSAQYRFVKLDGVHPEAGSRQGNLPTPLATSAFYTARNSSVSGDYRFVMELRSFVANTADTFGALLIPAISATLGNPANCTNTPRGISISPLAGSSCLSADNTATPNNPGFTGVGPTAVPLPAFNEAVVAKGTKLGNNCRPSQMTQ